MKSISQLLRWQNKGPKVEQPKTTPEKEFEFQMKNRKFVAGCYEAMERADRCIAEMKKSENELKISSVFHLQAALFGAFSSRVYSKYRPIVRLNVDFNGVSVFFSVQVDGSTFQLRKLIENNDSGGVNVFMYFVLIAREVESKFSEWMESK